jgi:acyl-CoA thioesterase
MSNGVIGPGLVGLADSLRIVRTADTEWSLDLDPRWGVGDRAHGGFLVAAMAKAAAAGMEHRDPLVVSAHFLASPSVGPVAIEVEILRRGRSASQVRCRLWQGDLHCVEAIVTLGKLDLSAKPRWVHGGVPAVAASEECVRVPVRRGRSPVHVWDAVDVRIDPATAGWTERRPGGSAEMRGHVVFARPVDISCLLVAVDILPSTVLELGSYGWVPTLELTAYIRAIPADGPLLVQQRTLLVEGGYADQACDIWDSGGHLVAQAVQFAGVRFRDDEGDSAQESATRSVRFPPE